MPNIFQKNNSFQVIWPHYSSLHIVRSKVQPVVLVSAMVMRGSKRHLFHNSFALANSATELRIFVLHFIMKEVVTHVRILINKKNDDDRGVY